MQHAFGEFLLSPSARQLTRAGMPVRIGGRAFDILVVLAENRGAVVSKRTLLERVWQDSHGDDAGLRVHIAGLRRMLEAEAAGVQVVNVPGRGYSLVVEEAPDAAANDVTAHNLPARKLRLVGREEITAALAEEIRGHRLITMIGPGGMGKTSIALSVAERLLPEFARVRLIDLSSVEDASNAIVSIAVSLQLTPDRSDPTGVIVNALKGRRTLVIFDNCEHVVDEIALLTDTILRDAGEVHVLATSREALLVEGERVIRVPPLPCPSGQVASAEEALAYPAVRLFVERAAEAAQYVFEDRDAATVSEICRQLDGMPFAIELAAAWVNTFPPAVLLGELGKHLMLVAKGRRTALPRHRTIEAMLGWSYDRLPAANRLLFARLSVFSGEFSLQAAVAVAVGGDLSGGMVMEGIAELVAKSMIDVRADSGETCYRLLLVPRAYGQQKLEAGPDPRTARLNHAQLVLSWLRNCEREWIDEGREIWVQRYSRRLDDIRKALAWASSPEGDLRFAVDIACEASVVWFRLSIPSEGRTYMDAILRDFSPDLEHHDRRLTRLRAMYGVMLMFTRSDLDDIRAAWDAADKLAADSDDRDSQMLGRWAAWLLASLTQNHEASHVAAQEFRELARFESAGSRIAADRMVGYTHFSLGRLEEARILLERVVLYASADPRPPTGPLRFQYDQTSSSLALLARIYWLQGDTAAAVEAVTRSVSIAEATGHGMTVSYALLDGLAQLAALMGDRGLLEQAMAKEGNVAGDIIHSAQMTDAALGALLAELGEHEAAAVLIKKALLRDSVNVFLRIVGLVGRMCEALGHTGDPRLGLELLEKVSASIGTGPHPARPELLRARARLVLMDRGPDGRVEAEALLIDALDRATAQGSLGWERRIRLDLARLLQSLGRGDEAATVLKALDGRLEEDAPITGEIERLAADLQTGAGALHDAVTR